MQEIRFREALQGVLQGSLRPVMHHQPIADLRRGSIVGYEALVRFPVMPSLSPEEWFRSAEARGKRVQLEALLAEIALESRSLLPNDTFLSVNISPCFLLSPECSTMLARSAGLARVVVEITESDRVVDYTAFRRRLEQLREMGASIAVDDTGSGYASLKHVMELRPQFVKLDRFFISGCQHDPVKSALIGMIGDAADSMDAWLVAEGIEEEGELFELMRHRVPLGQGYLLGKPSLQMAQLPGDLSAAIRERRELPTPGSLCHHVESVAVTPDAAKAEHTIRTKPHVMCAVVVDGYRRPTHIVEAHHLAGMRTHVQPMRVQLSSSVTEVLRRAMSRPTDQRFDPLVAVNERGEFEGLLRIDRLTQAALETVV